jgi:hypothetical protein
MASVIDTLGKAARHGMLLRVECPSCGRRKFYDASALMMVYGGGRDPRDLPFSRCLDCTPKPRVTVHEIDRDRTRRLRVEYPKLQDGKLVGWETGWL